MTTTSKTLPVAVLFSGGLDSAVLVGHLLASGRTVQPLYVNSQLVWQSAERVAAVRFLELISQPRLRLLCDLTLPLDDVYGPHWSVTGAEIPDALTDDVAVDLPARNALMLLKSALWCRQNGIEYLAVGCLRTSPFADAKASFFESLRGVLADSLDESIEIMRPLAKFDKQQVMRLGAELPLGETFSCIAPVGQRHCGGCNKCAERQTAFRVARIPDSTRYAVALCRV
jgi:7-cyano-7-deazaguanine synthase